MRATSFFLVALSACGSSGDGDAMSAPGATSAQSSGAGAAGGEGGSGGAGGTGGGTWTPPPSPAACDAQQATVMGIWMAAAGERLASTHLVWGGTEAAIAYAESNGMNEWDIQFQRLLENGLTKSKRVTLGKVAQGFPPRLSVATSGEGYIVCWDGANVACSAVPLGAGNGTPGLTVAGQAPAVTFGVGGWALVYGDGTDLLGQRLDDAAKAVGEAKPVAPGGPSVYPVIAATTTGFAVAYSNVDVQRLNGALAPVAAPVHLAGNISSSPVVAASGEKLAVVWNEKNVSVAVLDASNQVTGPTQVDFPNAEVPYDKVAIAGALDSFGVAWSAFEGFIGYRGVDGSGTPIGMGSKPIDSMWDDCPVAIAAVSDGFLVASAIGLAADTIKVAHLACP